MKRFYLLSYCTPSRKGEHRVRIVAKTGGEQDENAEWGSGEVTREDELSEDEKKELEKSEKKAEKNEKSKSGRLEYTFVADGFGPPPTCDPERKPHFKLRPEDEQENGDPAGKADGSSGKASGSSGKASAEVKTGS